MSIHYTLELRGKSVGDLIKKLNPIIRDIENYYKGKKIISDQKEFSFLVPKIFVHPLYFNFRVIFYIANR